MRALVALVLALALPAAAAAQAPPSDPDVLAGIRLVEEGEYDQAILTLDNAARRLVTDSSKAGDLSQAYLHLGIAYLGKGQEAAARARFREAIAQIKGLTLSPDKFPPKVINAFEAAKEETASASASAPAPVELAPAPAPEKKGSKKVLLIAAGVAAAGGAVAIGAGGGSSGSATPSTPVEPRARLDFSGTLAPQTSQPYEVVARAAGTLEARLSWQNGQIELRVTCQEKEPPYTQCPGTWNRTTQTSGVYTTPVTQKTYLLLVDNFTGGTEPFQVTFLAP